MLKQNSDTSVSVSDFLVCSRWFCQQLFKTGAVFVLSPPHFFFPAFCADLVVLPVVSFFSTLLITPTATVCFMSRTANLPKGGYSWNDSTHIGLLGVSLTMAASPDLTLLGLSSSFLPERRSIFSINSVNLQAM